MVGRGEGAAGGRRHTIENFMSCPPPMCGDSWPSWRMVCWKTLVFLHKAANIWDRTCAGWEAQVVPLWFSTLFHSVYILAGLFCRSVLK